MKVFQAIADTEDGVIFTYLIAAKTEKTELNKNLSFNGTEVQILFESVEQAI